MQKRWEGRYSIDYIDRYERAGYYTQTNDVLALQMSGANPANKQLLCIRAELGTGLGLDGAFFSP